MKCILVLTWTYIREDTHPFCRESRSETQFEGEEVALKVRVQFTHVETRKHLVKLEMGEIEILISCNYAANVTPKQNTKRTPPSKKKQIK